MPKSAIILNNKLALEFLVVLVILLTQLIGRYEAQTPTKLSELDAFNTEICGKTHVRSGHNSKLGRSRKHRLGHSPRHQHDAPDYKSIGHRISAGWPAQRGEFPWFASIEINFLKDGRQKNLLCGGTLIHNNLVLTAAHCLADRGSSTTIIVRLGMFRKREYSHVQSVETKTICKMEGWTERFLENTTRQGYDVGIIELEHPVEYDKFVQPACLRDLHSPVEPMLRPERQDCLVIGMGLMSLYPHVIADQLLAMPSQACSPEELAKLDHREDEDCFSSSDPRWIGGACPGDSGGGMLCTDLNNGRVHVIGVVSNGKNICSNRTNNPTNYASLFKLRTKLIETFSQCFNITS